MTTAEKKVISDIVLILENLIVRDDALEGALIGKSLIPDGLVGQLEAGYRKRAMSDLALLRMSLANLPLTENAKG